MNSKIIVLTYFIFLFLPLILKVESRIRSNLLVVCQERLIIESQQVENHSHLYCNRTPNHDDTPSAMAITGWALVITNDPIHAISYLQMAINQQSYRPFYRLYLGEAYNRINQKEAAVIEWKQVSGASKWLRDRGILARLSGNNQEAINLYLFSIELDPSDSKNYILLGDAYSSLGRRNEASSAYSKAAEFMDDPFQMEMLKGLSSLMVNDWAGAFTAYQKAQVINPNYAEPYYRLGYVWYWGYKNLKMAVSLINKAIKLEPANPDAYMHLGLIYADAGYLQQAIQPIQTAISLAPNRPEYSIRLAEIFMKSRDYCEALKLFTKVENEFPKINTEEIQKQILLLKQETVGQCN